MIDLVTFIKAIGYLGLFAVIFSESGLFIGFFLPGDSLLFTAGFLASQGFLDLKILLLVTFLGAVLGDNFGYSFGRKVGPKIFRKEESLFFHKDHIKRAGAFYEKYGPKTIILARFVPIVRTFAPILAGVGGMNYRTFLFYNFLGGVLWAIGLTTLGFWLGETVPSADEYLFLIIGFIILLSFLPVLTHFARDGNLRDRLFRRLGLKK